MDRVELAQTLANLPQRELTLVLGFADVIRNSPPEHTTKEGHIGSTLPKKFASTTKKRPGRPKGSKNKPKVTPPVVDAAGVTGGIITEYPPVPDGYGENN